MTRLLEDILRQPPELSRLLGRLTGAQAGLLAEAAAAIRHARHVHVTGIGSSWAASISVAALFQLGGRAVTLTDASELAHFAEIPPESVMLVLSRSGRSAEIVELIPLVRRAGAYLIAITNAKESPLARAADVCIPLEMQYDHAVSVNMYSGVALAGAVLAATAMDRWSSPVASEIEEALREAGRFCGDWREAMESSAWFSAEAPAYFLARGPSLASCHEAHLLWEEAAKVPATAMTAGAFRHGPQEMIRPGIRFGIWIDPVRMREADLNVVEDLRRLGCSVMLVGQNLPRGAADLTLSVPQTPADWQFVVDMIPAQLAAERLSRLRGVDCDTLRLCPFIVEDESRLMLDGHR